MRLPSPYLYSGDPEHEINGVYKVLSSLLTKFIHCSRNIIEQVLGGRASAENKRSCLHRIHILWEETIKK